MAGETREELRTKLEVLADKLDAAQDRIVDLEEQLENAADGEDDDPNDVLPDVDRLVEFIEKTEPNYPTPELYRRDLNELVRVVSEQR